MIRNYIIFKIVLRRTQLLFFRLRGSGRGRIVMLQPAVENSIFHGIAPKDSPGRLEIEARQENETLVITVTDDGVGISPEQLREIMREDYTQNTGIHKIGIGNVNKRIQEMYGPPYALTLESELRAWTRVVIRIPMEKKEE